jgi:fumarylacetoacetate (FAA) hydrolase
MERRITMKLATLKTEKRDGTLIVVDQNLKWGAAVPAIARTMQEALDRWEESSAQLAAVYYTLTEGRLEEAFLLEAQMLAAPLPRAYQWLDGSAYLSHVELVRRARGGEMSPEFKTDPLMYQGCSDICLGPRDAILVENEEWGIDFEAEVAVITDDVPMGLPPHETGAHIKLLMLVNDVSLRHLIRPELVKGFGFLHSKPPSSFSPVAVTPDELASAWDGAKVHLPLITYFNGELFGRPDAATDMHFDFPTLISHAAKSRPLGAGTIIGSGTVSNGDRSRGSSCLVEKQMLEIIERGKATTAYMRFGDRVRIEMFDKQGQSIFGAIDQVVRSYRRGRPRQEPRTDVMEEWIITE